ncbi:MAG: hypothetical protein J7497_05115 [Chitinophagaceae bacterium]|nr:hypothetical protein [Chitinophagaceae bacterium]
MKKLFYALFIITAGCGAGGYEIATDPQDAGREFIRASLDGDTKKARFYLLKDTTNNLMMDRFQRDYERLSHEEKNKYRESVIRPVNIKAINDSTTIYTYYHTQNPKDTTSIRIVRAGAQWLVDIKSIIKQ